jgi:hypothetical protein
MNKPSFDLLAIYRQGQGQAILFGHVMICLMMATIALAFALFGARLIPGWNGVYLVWVCMLIAMEAIYTRKRTEELDFRDRIFFHLSEWIAFAVALKLLLYAMHGIGQILVDLPLWQKNFLENFFTGEYIFALVVTGLVWLVTMAYAGELEGLYNREEDAIWDELGKLQNSLHDLRRRIATRIFIIGAGVVILAVLSRIDTTFVLGQRSSGVAFFAPVIDVLAYFVLALVLLSQTQFALLRTRWLWQRTPISARLASNWLRYGLLSFLILAVIVFFLPTHYSIGLLDTLRYALNYISQAFTFLMVILTLPFTLCMTLLSLFSGSKGVSQQPAPQPQLPPPGVPAQPIAWIEFLRSLLFWGIFIAVIFFALRYYLSQNVALWKTITSFPLFRWIGGTLRGFWAWIRGANRQISSLVQASIKRLRAQRVSISAQGIRRIFNLSRMSPRERIIYFYLSLVQLSGERGIDRRPAQTPYQYERQINNAIPEIEPDLHTLTDTFLEARYSQHPFEPAQSEKAGSLWDRMKEIIRKWKPLE